MKYNIGDIVCWKDNMKLYYGVIVDTQTIVTGTYPNHMTRPGNAFVIQDELGLLHIKKAKELLTIN